MPLLFSIIIGLNIVLIIALMRSPLITILPSELRNILRKCYKTEGNLKHQSPVIETSVESHMEESNMESNMMQLIPCRMESNMENVFLYHTMEQLL